MTKTEPLDDSIESMGVTTAVSTMTAIVHDEYGTAPEDVLRLDEVDKPAINTGAGRLGLGRQPPNARRERHGNSTRPGKSP
jgi:hypothetical protein